MFLGKTKKRIETLEKEIALLQKNCIVREKKRLEMVNKSPNKLPSYANPGDSGFDLHAWIDKNTNSVLYDEEKGKYYVEIAPNEVKLIHTGLYINIPEHFEIQVRPRSGYALKVGVTVNNAPGTIDGSYLGEIGVICLNPTKKPVRISNDDKIAQAVLCLVWDESLVDIVEVDKIDKTTVRGANGYGSSGK